MFAGELTEVMELRNELGEVGAMRFSWSGLILAPMAVPLLLSAVLVNFFGSSNWAVGFLILFVPGCVVSYGTMLFLFLPCLWLVSRVWRMTGARMCLLGLVLGALVFIPTTFAAWGSSGPDSGPPA